VVGGYWLGVVCLLCDLTFSLTLPFVSAVTTRKLRSRLWLCFWLWLGFKLDLWLWFPSRQSSVSILLARQ